MSFVFGDMASADKSVLFAESFDDCNGTGANDNNWLTFRTGVGTFRPDNEGWTATYMKGGRHCGRFGNMAAEDVVTPSIHFNGSSTLAIRVAPFAAEGTMTMKLSTDNPDISLSATSVTLTPQEWTEFKTEVSGTGEARITLSADCRLYIDDMMVVDNTQTGIEEIDGGYIQQENAGKNAAYDLSGRRIHDMNAKGIYIVNGKKVVR